MNLLRRFAKGSAIVVASMTFVAFASWTSLRAQRYQCQDPNFYCEPKGRSPDSGKCPGVPLFYTSTTVEPQLVSICALGAEQNCENIQTATCITKHWIADATKNCGTVVCYSADFALGCSE